MSLITKGSGDRSPKGFNNLRMAFEYFVGLANESGRTLVLPLREGWYLIDWGPLTAKNKADEHWIQNGSGSTYSHFFDVEHLKLQGLPVISAIEFRNLNSKDNQPVPDESELQKLVNTPDDSPWKKWLFDNGKVAASCSEANKLAHSDARVVHLPYNERGPSKQMYRFFECKNQKGKAMLQYNPRFYEAAAVAVSALGAGQYVAIHLRMYMYMYIYMYMYMYMYMNIHIHMYIFMYMYMYMYMKMNM